MILIILLCLISQVFGVGYESLVPSALHKCCNDGLSETCGGIDTITRGQDGHHYVFTNDYVIKTHFNARGYPQILNSNSYSPNSDWFPRVKLVRTNATESGVLDSSQPRAAFLMNGIITVMKDGRFYQFDNPKNLTRYDSTCDDAIKSTSLHPLYCDLEQGQLVDVTISNARGRERDPEVKAYFNDEGVIYEKNYAGTRAMKGRNKTPFQGMSSIFIYHEQVMVHSRSIADFGYAFEDTGYACRFVLRKDEVTEHDSPALHAPFMNCLPSNIFLGCPQSWCYRADLDDLLLSTFDTPGTMSGSSVVVYRGHYFFESEAKIPVIAPPVESHKVLTPGNSNKGRHPFIDACFEVSDGSSEFMGFIKESDIIMYNSPSGSGTVRKVYDVFPGIWDPVLMTDNFGSIDASFYSRSNSRLYLLVGSSFASYSYEIEGGTYPAISFRLEEAGSFTEHFPGLPANIDGATAFGGNVYLFKDNWVYAIPENQVGISAVYPELAYHDPESGSGFFQADHCGKSPADWRALRSQVIQPLPATQTESSELELTASYSNWYLTFFVFLILLMLWAIPYMFTCCYCSRKSFKVPLLNFEFLRTKPVVSEIQELDNELSNDYNTRQVERAHPGATENLITF